MSIGRVHPGIRRNGQRHPPHADPYFVGRAPRRAGGRGGVGGAHVKTEAGTRRSRQSRPRECSGQLRIRARRARVHLPTPRAFRRLHLRQTKFGHPAFAGCWSIGQWQTSSGHPAEILGKARRAPPPSSCDQSGEHSSPRGGAPVNATVSYELNHVGCERISESSEGQGHLPKDETTAASATRRPATGRVHFQAREMASACRDNAPNTSTRISIGTNTPRGPNPT